MTHEGFIPVASPALAGNERKYVLDCLDSTWISSTGEYVNRFESAFAEFCSTRYAAACSSGTAALHLALLALGVGPGDEVIVPTLTFVATANAVTYCGATPVFVDSDPETWNLDPELLEEKITMRTKAIIVVHLYGHPADMDPIMSLAARHGISVVEDAAEAQGARYNGREVGSLGSVAVFSFYGNKVLTTGEGGMVVTDDRAIMERVRLFRGQGMDPQRRYWFPVVGFNYRLTNVAAAIGLGQVERAEWHVRSRAEIHSWYVSRLLGHDGLRWQTRRDHVDPSFWMVTLALTPEAGITRDDMMKRLLEKGIETRPVFYPMHVLPPYRATTDPDSFPVAAEIARSGLSLPTWNGLKQAEVERVCDAVLEELQ